MITHCIVSCIRLTTHGLMYWKQVIQLLWPQLEAIWLHRGEGFHDWNVVITKETLLYLRDLPLSLMSALPFFWGYHYTSRGWSATNVLCILFIDHVYFRLGIMFSLSRLIKNTYTFISFYHAGTNSKRIMLGWNKWHGFY